MGLVTGRGVTIHQGKEVSEGVGLQGASPNVGVITNYEAEDGRFLSEIENQRHMNVAYIGHDLKDKFFPGSRAVLLRDCGHAPLWDAPDEVATLLLQGSA